MAYKEVLCREDAPPPDEVRRSITPVRNMHMLYVVSYVHNNRLQVYLTTFMSTNDSQWFIRDNVSSCKIN